jgi:glycerophosphoryl diester phosphodiesterase
VASRHRPHVIARGKHAAGLLCQHVRCVQQRLPPLLTSPILFAHRGARADARENTVHAFELALELGATGLESDVWVTADGEVVLDHDGVVGRVKKRKINDLERLALPAHIPTLGALIEACGTGYDLSLDLKDSRSGPAVIDLLQRIAPELLPRTWLCHPDLEVLIPLRPLSSEIKLVNSTRLMRITEGPERRAARLAESGIDGINLRKDDWTGGLVTLFHRFERTAFSWDLQFDHELVPALRMGVDAVFSDHVRRMVTAYRSVY